MKRSKNQKRLVLGVLIIAFGVIALLEKTFRGLHLLEFWPVVFMVLGTMKIVQTEHRSGYILGVILLVLGCLMTLSNLGWIQFRLRDWWPLLLIGGGILLLFKGQQNDAGSAGQPAPKFDMPGSEKPGTITIAAAATATPDSASTIDSFGIMSGNKINVISQAFGGGEATAIMGGIEIDMRMASMQKPATLHLFAVWGGIELVVPNDWVVINNVVAIMGGVDDKTVPPLNPEKCLILEGYVVMAGVEIKNK